MLAEGTISNLNTKHTSAMIKGQFYFKGTASTICDWYLIVCYIFTGHIIGQGPIANVLARSVI